MSDSRVVNVKTGATNNVATSIASANVALPTIPSVYAGVFEVFNNSASVLHVRTSKGAGVAVATDYPIAAGRQALITRGDANDDTINGILEAGTGVMSVTQVMPVQPM